MVRKHWLPWTYNKYTEEAHSKKRKWQQHLVEELDREDRLFNDYWLNFTICRCCSEATSRMNEHPLQAMSWGKRYLVKIVGLNKQVDTSDLAGQCNQTNIKTKQGMA